LWLNITGGFISVKRLKRAVLDTFRGTF